MKTTTLCAAILLLVCACSSDDDKKKKPDPDFPGGNGNGNSEQNKKEVDQDDDDRGSEVADDKIPFVSGSWDQSLQGSLEITSLNGISLKDFDALDFDEKITADDLSELQSINVGDDNEGYHLEICLSEPRTKDQVEDSFHLLDDESLFVDSNDSRVREFITFYNDDSLNTGLKGFQRSNNCVYAFIKFSDELQIGSHTLLLRVRDTKACNEYYRARGEEENRLGLSCNAFFDDYKNRFDKRFDTVISLPVEKS